jgi:hypothetical protein
MISARKVPLFVLAALLLPACSEPLVTLGPTPPNEGVTFYIHAGFSGPSQAVNLDVRDLARVEGPCTGGAEGEQPTWGDCISSLRVIDGWRATLYEDKDFQGRNVTVTADTPDLTALPGPCSGTFNDCLSSLKVTRQ